MLCMQCYESLQITEFSSKVHNTYTSKELEIIRPRSKGTKKSACYFMKWWRKCFDIIKTISNIIQKLHTFMSYNYSEPEYILKHEKYRKWRNHQFWKCHIKPAFQEISIPFTMNTAYARTRTQLHKYHLNISFGR